MHKRYVVNWELDEVMKEIWGEGVDAMIVEQ